MTISVLIVLSHQWGEAWVLWVVDQTWCSQPHISLHCSLFSVKLLAQWQGDKNQPKLFTQRCCSQKSNPWYASYTIMPLNCLRLVKANQIQYPYSPLREHGTAWSQQPPRILILICFSCVQQPYVRVGHVSTTARVTVYSMK